MNNVPVKFYQNKISAIEKGSFVELTSSYLWNTIKKASPRNIFYIPGQNYNNIKI